MVYQRFIRYPNSCGCFPIVQGIGIASGAGRMQAADELALQVMLARQAGAVGFVGFAYQPDHTTEFFAPLQNEMSGGKADANAN